jgi:hypothetical protein
MSRKIASLVMAEGWLGRFCQAETGKKPNTTTLTGHAKRAKFEIKGVL